MSRVYAVAFIDVWEFRVLGVKSVPTDQIEQAVYPYLGEARTIDDIDQAVQAVHSLYKLLDMPTAAVYIPEQDVLGGIVKIQVEESEIRRLKVVGSRYFSLHNIKSSFPSVAQGQTLNISALQEDVKKANQINPDLKIVPSLNAGPVPGSVDVDLNVSDSFPLHGGLEVTNYSTQGTTDTRASADLSYGNLFQRNHQLSLQVQSSPENTDEVQVLAGSYLLPTNDRGSKLASYLVVSDSDLATVSGITVVGEGTVLGSRWIQPLSQSSKMMHNLSLGFDYKDFKEVQTGIDGFTLLSQTPMEYLTFSLDYNFFGRRKRGTDSFSSGFTFGSGLLSDNKDFNLKRSQADANFVAWRLSWNRSYTLSKKWRFSHVLRGQISDSPLVSNEQFMAGGITSVRAYYESQISGDKGYIASIEFARSLLENKWKWLNDFSAHFYFDMAETFLNEPLPDQQDAFSIRSAGLGFRAELAKRVQLKLDAATAFEDEGSVEEGDTRVLGSIRYDF